MTMSLMMMMMMMTLRSFWRLEEKGKKKCQAKESTDLRGKLSSHLLGFLGWADCGGGGRKGGFARGLVAEGKRGSYALWGLTTTTMTESVDIAWNRNRPTAYISWKTVVSFLNFTKNQFTINWEPTSLDSFEFLNRISHCETSSLSITKFNTIPTERKRGGSRTVSEFQLSIILSEYDAHIAITFIYSWQFVICKSNANVLHRIGTHKIPLESVLLILKSTTIHVAPSTRCCWTLRESMSSRLRG